MGDNETIKAISSFLEIIKNNKDEKKDQIWEEVSKQNSLKKDDEEKLLISVIDNTILQNEELIKNYIDNRDLSKK
jgi:hypothetical protein